MDIFSCKSTLSRHVRYSRYFPYISCTDMTSSLQLSLDLYGHLLLTYDTISNL